MKDNTAISNREIRTKSLYDFSNLPITDQDPNNFFFLSDYCDKRNPMYTLKSVYKFLNKKYLKKNQKDKVIPVSQRKENNYYLPNIVSGFNKEKEIESKKPKILLNTNAMNTNDTIKNEDKNSFDSLNLMNSYPTNNKILINKRLTFSNCILEQVYNTNGINNSKKGSSKDLDSILANNNSFFFNNLSSNTKSFEGSELKNKENIYLNNNFNNSNYIICNNNNGHFDSNNNFKTSNNIIKYSNFEHEKSPRRTLKLENFQNENTNNNSIDETEIGVIGLFASNKIEKRIENLKSKNAQTNEPYNNYTNLAYSNNTCIENFKKDKSVREKSIEFQFIKNARIPKNENKSKRLEFNFKGLITKKK